ncbi:DNA mismatch repair protein, C-terminal [Penicillium expansum]|uniref:DNA mismatch repair protein, C-terminal n=1 Tax=Penicillium expansum TaxID=27334 RepID=A0A0A2IK75_PENEN|nr:DNA mismatch repair protein, C-terminal [Penicillium expansum]KGO35882.1 DNA mismatch repair protein, C-terminal [Penicillium expansum]KGO43474.1 DNA mismatch repair protein, C-terminal [Penicillium expansum]KGO60558.1 DNA mismatch repair protein, C-terminal [Penicillium expansum]
MEEDDMNIEPVDQRGTKRAAEENEPLEPPKPKKIKALDPDVVNKIAAGEIIVAPMHALKELIENAVDAGSTSIEVLIKEGGLKLLQITDNGHGIDRDDLPILCERFTTSKLKEFEDLTSIGTYGFRGEALASISHIAHLTVTTKTAGSSCAWRAHYGDGKLIPAKPGQSSAPKATAGRGGTQITVEDLFYNVPTRRRAFRSASEEYAKILDVVGRYAVHCSGVAFSCRKHGDSGVSISTPASANTVDRIRQIHGSAVANEVVEFKLEDTKFGFRASGLATNANYHVKKTVILLFINHRAVESTAVKRAIEQTYSAFLPKGGHPFVYLDLEIEPSRVDVNVHPTKREVNFLNEDEIIELVCTEIRSKLAEVDSSRTFLTQSLLPGVQTIESLQNDQGTPVHERTGEAPKAGATPKTPATTKRPYENNLIRTDSKVRKITAMLGPATASPRDPNNPNAPTETDTPTKPILDDGLQYETTDRQPLKIALSSVKSLRASVRSEMHNTLTEMFASHTYVGLVDERRRLAAIQSGVKLYLIDYGLACHEFFYQVGLTDFGNFGVIRLDPAPKLVDLLKIAAESERQEHSDSNGEEADSIFANAPEMIARTLVERREMLNEYFSLQISPDGDLLAIPLLLKGYLPALAKLPRFLLRLGPYVDWGSEEGCFRTFLRELATFYTPEQLPVLSQTVTQDMSGESATQGPVVADGSGIEGEDAFVRARRAQMVRMLEYAVFPALRARLVATSRLLRGVVEVADLKGLYRVFERC